MSQCLFNLASNLIDNDAFQLELFYATKKKNTLYYSTSALGRVLVDKVAMFPHIISVGKLPFSCREDVLV